MTVGINCFDHENSDSDDMMECSIDSGFYSAYESKEILGRGLASTVRRCVEKGSGLMFAVKIVDISSEKQPEQEARRLYSETLNEVALLRQLSDHPNIITLHDFYETPTFLFAVFEMAPKGELFDLLNRMVTISEKKARRIMRQLFDGVAFMHSKNIVHRDLKLENILCIDDERVVISDFGFAFQLTEDQKLKDLMGTPGYLAPETLKCQMYEVAEGYGIKVDIWALGVILYTLLAGYAPFYHRRQMIMLRLIQEGKFEFRNEQWGQITAEAKDLIRNMLMVDVEKRYTATMGLNHMWMKVPRAGTTKDLKSSEELKQQMRQRWRLAIILVRFFIRMTKIKALKLLVDYDEIRKRPYKDRDIRKESEAAVFAVYGHWINRGFYYSRDMLFANKPKPKFKPQQVAVSA